MSSTPDTRHPTLGTLPDWLDPTPWLKKEFRATDVERALGTELPDENTLAALLSPAAAEFLEPMAARAQALTRRHFGRTIQLYAPLYLSNFCNGGCLYCGFAADRRAQRTSLSQAEMLLEMQSLAKMGIQEVVMLTGERMPQADVPYLRDAIEIAAKVVHNINIEVFPMEEQEYRGLADAGCTGVTLYQETYDQDVYKRMHRWGDKSHFFRRLDAPDRALRGGMRAIGLGALLGLSDPRFDLMCMYRHAKYLLKNYWQSGVAISFPRLRPELGGFQADQFVSDRSFARFIFAFRICLPEIPLVLSTREPASMRDGLAGVGINKMSVESKTTVGGYGEEHKTSTGQFDISDERSVAEFCAMLHRKGLDPVFKNWDGVYRDAARYRYSGCVSA
jgi:2-iminoacetate synthase